MHSSLCRFHVPLFLFHFLAFKCFRLLCTFFLLFLSVAFTYDCYSFTSLPNGRWLSFSFSLSVSYSFSLSHSPPTVALPLSRFQMHSCLCRFHLTLLLFYFVAFKCIRLLCIFFLIFLFVAFTSDCYSFAFSPSSSPSAMVSIDGAATEDSTNPQLIVSFGVCVMCPLPNQVCILVL
jgi:hypothetical protein